MSDINWQELWFQMEVIEKFAAYIIFIAFIAGVLIYLGVTALLDYYRRKKRGIA